MVNKKILILGSTGFIGINLKKYILENYPDNYEYFYLNRKDVDFFDKNKLINSVNNINPEIVINCCGVVGSSIINSNSNEFDILNQNILLNANILDSCKNENVKKIILISSYRIFGNDIHENYNENDINLNFDLVNNAGYLLSKKILNIQIDFFKKYYNKNIICLILPNIFGENDNFCVNGRIIPSLIKQINNAKFHNEKLYINCCGDNLINLIHVTDVCAIIFISICDDKITGNIHIFNINGIFNLKNIANIISAYLNYNYLIEFNNDIYINTNIMKPNISKFNKLFTNYTFLDISNKLLDTIQSFTKVSL